MWYRCKCKKYYVHRLDFSKEYIFYIYYHQIYNMCWDTQNNFTLFFFFKKLVTTKRYFEFHVALVHSSESYHIDHSVITLTFKHGNHLTRILNSHWITEQAYFISTISICQTLEMLKKSIISYHITATVQSMFQRSNILQYKHLTSSSSFFFR